jgi:hypothetical protein
MSTGTGSRARGFQADSYGASAEYHREWYLHRNNRVLPKDLIVFCDWAGDAPIFSDQTDIYEIATVNILRGEGGADQYIKASANSDPVNLSLRLSVITRNIATVDYYVSIRPEGT